MSSCYKVINTSAFLNLRKGIGSNFIKESIIQRYKYLSLPSNFMGSEARQNHVLKGKASSLSRERVTSHHIRSICSIITVKHNKNDTLNPSTTKKNLYTNGYIQLFATKPNSSTNNNWTSTRNGNLALMVKSKDLSKGNCKTRCFCTSRYPSLSSSLTYEHKFESNDGIIMRFNLVKLKALNTRKPKLVNILLLEFTMVEDTFPYKDAKRFSISPLEAALILDLNDDEEMTLTRSQSTDPKTGEVARPSRSISFYIPKSPREKTMDIVVSEADPLTGEERIWGTFNLDRGRAALFRHLIQFAIPKLIENESENLIENLNPMTIPRPENAPF